MKQKPLWVNVLKYNTMIPTSASLEKWYGKCVQNKMTWGILNKERCAHLHRFRKCVWHPFLHPRGAPEILAQRVEPKSCLQVLTKSHCTLSTVGGLVIRELRMWWIRHLRGKAMINTRHCWAPTSTEQLWWIAGKTMTVQITWSPTPGKSQVADWHDNLSKMNVHSYCVNYK